MQAVHLVSSRVQWTAAAVSGTVTIMGHRLQHLLAVARTGLVRLSDREIALVGRTCAAARRTHLERTAVVVTWLGNGTLYLILAAALLVVTGRTSARTLALAAVAGAVSHLIYPAIKRVAARPRPFEHRGGPVAASAPLDAFSFPSGHLMTFAATTTPVVMRWPGVWLAALGLWLVLAWSRVATGHHYPSDLLGGTLLGVAVALGVTWVAG
jgi:undecaprenyl-diphosphatase